MFIKLTRSGDRTYAQLTEAYRDQQGKPRQRIITTLGRVDEAGGQVEAILAKLLLARGRNPSEARAPQVRFESALALGDVWALDQLWRELGFDSLAGVFRRARFKTPVEHALRVMVFNRLCDPESKLGVLRWLETVSLPGISAGTLTHQQLLRSMDALMDHQQSVDEHIAGLLRPLIDDELSIVFYDLTTIRAEGQSEQAGEIRRFGLSKEGGIGRQFLLGVVQTAEGLPIYHEVFAGNTAEAPTLEPTLARVLKRYPHIRRLVVVADRGLLSIDNLEQLKALALQDERSLEFILAVPGRRYGEFDETLEDLQEQSQAATEEIVAERTWQGHRLIVAHAPERAREHTAERRQRIAALEARAAQLAGKLDAQDAGVRARGRRLSDSGAKARFFHEVCEASLARIVKVDLASDLFHYDIDERALARAERLDGKLLLVTNVPDLSPNEIVAHYKALADIERGFRVLKSEIEIAPVYHRLPERIRAHASLCFIALILYWAMRLRLKQAGSDLSPEAALARLRRIQRHTITIDGGSPVSGISTIDHAQASVLAALNVRKPTTRNEQLPLL